MLIRLLPALFAGLLAFQEVPSLPGDDKPVEWICPMDRDVRTKGPGKCPRCGMTLVAGIPDFVEFATKIHTNPRTIRPDVSTAMTFEIVNPTTHKRVTDFEVMH